MCTSRRPHLKKREKRKHHFHARSFCASKGARDARVRSRRRDDFSACGVDFFVSCLCVEIVCLCVRCSAVLCARSSEGVVNSRVSLPIRMISGSIFDCQCRHVDAGSKVPDLVRVRALTCGCKTQTVLRRDREVSWRAGARDQGHGVVCGANQASRHWPWRLGSGQGAR